MESSDSLGESSRSSKACCHRQCVTFRQSEQISSSRSDCRNVNHFHRQDYVVRLREYIKQPLELTIK